MFFNIYCPYVDCSVYQIETSKFKQALISYCRILLFVYILLKNFFVTCRCYCCMYSLARIPDARLVRVSILSIRKIRSSLRINISTKNTFDTRRSGIRKVHAVHTYPRKVLVLGFYLDRREIMLARFHLIRIHLARCISRRSCGEAHKDNDNPDNTNYPSSRRDKSLLYPLIYRMFLKCQPRSWNT